MNRKLVSYILLCHIALFGLSCFSYAAIKQDNESKVEGMTTTQHKRLTHQPYGHTQVRHRISVKKSATMPSQALLLMKQDALISNNLEQGAWLQSQLNIYQACRALLQC